MIVDFMCNYNTDRKWHCIATKNITVVPQEGTTVSIKEDSSSYKKNYIVKRVTLDVDFPKYIVYLS